jgi:hypothetical protein
MNSVICNGSCFNEDCRSVRCYVLSTGVAVRGTRGQCDEILGGVQIAVDFQTT